MSPPQPALRSDEVGGATIAPICFDLPAAIQRVLDSWQPQTHGNGVQLLSELLPGVPQYITGVPTQLEQVLDKLLGNAVRFTQTGSITVAVDNMCMDGADLAMLRFAIQDTGAGMPRQTLETLLAQLAHADGGNTGHGLSVCKQLLETMQGEIMVDSAAGSGTCITVILPFARAAAGATTQGSATATFAPRHILVVDDNDINRIVCTSLLEKMGYRTTTAVNGLEAVTAAEREHYDLILMDCHMPVLDGLDATRSIRAWERATGQQALPIIAVSASAFADDRQRCAEAGMNDFLPKPLTVNSLRQMLDSWLPSAEQTPTSAADKPEDAASATTALQLPTQFFCHAQFTATRTLAGSKFSTILLRFAEDAQCQLAVMQQAAAGNDAEGLRRSTHKLKGSSGSIGAQQLAKLCNDLERDARNETLASAEKQVVEIDHCLQATLAALQPFMNTG